MSTSALTLSPSSTAQFGLDFKSVGNLQWNKAFCEMDSDGDGVTNGEELGDPCCLWTPENTKPEGFRTTELSHPGEKGEVGKGAKCLTVATTTSATSSSVVKPAATSSAGAKNGSDSNSCFPGEATVQRQSAESGGLQTVRMSELSIGDRVLVGAGGAVSDVFMFTHKTAHEMSSFIRIVTEAGHSVAATPGHYFPIENHGLLPASAIQVGNAVQIAASGRWSPVVSLSRVALAGLYNPQTIHGDIVVDGVVASTYTTAVHPKLAHRLLAPFRTVYSSFSLILTLLERESASSCEL
jgi:Hint module